MDPIHLPSDKAAVVIAWGESKHQSHPGQFHSKVSHIKISRNCSVIRWAWDDSAERGWVTFANKAQCACRGSMDVGFATQNKANKKSEI